MALLAVADVVAGHAEGTASAGWAPIIMANVTLAEPDADVAEVPAQQQTLARDVRTRSDPQREGKSTIVTAEPTSTTPCLPRIDPGRLRLLNMVFGVTHLIQAVLFIVLSTSVDLDVTALFASGPPGSPIDPAALEVLFSYRLGPAIALFSLLSAVLPPADRARHGAGPATVAELACRRNRFRWVEYSLSASLMIVLIAGITGITDVVALLALFGVNASMILFGWLMETDNDPDRAPTGRRSCSAASPAPCRGSPSAIYLIGAGDDVPTFVYGIFVTLFVLFNCFAVNQWLQYRRTGRWADYLFGERVYVWLSLDRQEPSSPGRSSPTSSSSSQWCLTPAAS